MDYENISWKLSNVNFHEIPRFSEDKNDIRNNGWIHQDVDVFGNDEVAGLMDKVKKKKELVLCIFVQGV